MPNKSSTASSSSPYHASTQSTGEPNGEPQAPVLERRRSSLREHINDVHDLHRSLKIGQACADQGLEDALKAQRELRRTMQCSHFGEPERRANPTSESRPEEAPKSLEQGSSDSSAMDSKVNPNGSKRSKHHRHRNKLKEGEGSMRNSRRLSGDAQPGEPLTEQLVERRHHRHSLDGASSHRRDATRRMSGGTALDSPGDEDFQAALARHLELKEILQKQHNAQQILPKQFSFHSSTHSSPKFIKDEGKAESSPDKKTSPSVISGGQSRAPFSSSPQVPTAHTPSASTRPFSPEFEEALLAYKRSFTYLHRGPDTEGQSGISKQSCPTPGKTLQPATHSRPHHLPPLSSEELDRSPPDDISALDSARKEESQSCAPSSTTLFADMPVVIPSCASGVKVSPKTGARPIVVEGGAHENR